MATTESYSVDTVEKMTLDEVKKVCNLMQVTIPEKILIFEDSSDFAVTYTVFSEKIVTHGFKFLWWNLGEVKKKITHCYFETDLFSYLGIRISDSRFFNITKTEMEELANKLEFELVIEKDFLPAPD